MSKATKTTDKTKKSAEKPVVKAPVEKPVKPEPIVVPQWSVSGD